MFVSKVAISMAKTLNLLMTEFTKIVSNTKKKISIYVLSIEYFSESYAENWL
jgi:hypothetical protein